MSRNIAPLTHAGAAAFDFDVVTDVPPPPVRKPNPAPEPAANGADRKRAGKLDAVESAARTQWGAGATQLRKRLL